VCNTQLLNTTSSTAGRAGELSASFSATIHKLFLIYRLDSIKVQGGTYNI
jgi:hypothetical protein